MISQISRIPLISRIMSFAFASGASNIGMYQCRVSAQTNSYEVYLRYPRYFNYGFLIRFVKRGPVNLIHFQVQIHRIHFKIQTMPTCFERCDTNSDMS
jgi:hypothetical protein